MLQTLFGWAVVGTIVVLSIGTGFGVLSMTPPRYRIAEVCYCVAAVLLMAKVTAWIVTEKAPVKERLLVTFLIFGAIGLGWSEALRWVDSMIPHIAPAIPTTKLPQASNDNVVGAATAPLAPAAETKPSLAQVDANTLRLHRQTVQRDLIREYILSHDGLTAAEIAGTEITQREAEWINGRLKEKGEIWKVSPTTKPSTPTPVIIQTAPTFGNIKERAVALSREIMSDLYTHGWPPGPGQQIPPGFVTQQMPTTGNELSRWIKSRSGYFRFRFFERVLDIRNEFAQLHLRDERLDDFFKYQGMIEQANKQMAAIDPQRQIDSPILPQQIEEVAERLRVLADQIK